MWLGIFVYLYLQIGLFVFDLESLDFWEAMSNLYLHVLDASLTVGIVIVLVLLVRLLLRRVPKVYSYALWLIVLARLFCPYLGVSPVGIVPVVDSVWEEYTDVLFLRFIWPVGMAVMVIYSQVHYWWIKKRLSDSVKIGKRVYLSDHIATPFVMGIIRPSIYLPSALEKDDRQFVLYHELHHIQRKDHLIKIIAFVFLCVHWFNPLVWIGFWLMSRDLEMSCDEAVVKELKQDLKADVRADYSSLLLELSIGETMISGAPLAFGEGNTRARIFNLAGSGEIPLRRHLYAALMMIIACFCLLTNRDHTESIMDTVNGDESISQVWEVKRIIYGEKAMGDYADDWFRITENGRLGILKNGDLLNGSEVNGQFSEISLSKWKFDELFVKQSEMWTNGRNLAASLRRHNRRAWYIFQEHSDEGPVLYYLLQQTNGSVYLVMGRYDKLNFADWFDDSSQIWWMCELQKVEN